MNDVFRYSTVEPSRTGISTNNVKTEPPRFVTNPNPSGAGLLDLLKDVPNARMIEIGTDVGDTSAFLLENKPDLTIYSVDPYQNYIDWNGNDLNEREEVYQFMMERMKVFGKRFVQIRRNSYDAVDVLYNNDDYNINWQSIDLIFIDGIHTYEAVLRDCQRYWPLCKVGGIFAGHDYDGILGVKKAVDEFAAGVNHKIEKTFLDVWYMRRA